MLKKNVLIPEKSGAEIDCDAAEPEIRIGDPDPNGKYPVPN